MIVYLDNASTTRVHADVLECMLPYMMHRFGNPSSLHRFGREAKVAIENSRAQISSLVGANAGEIFFTSGGTEGNNTILGGAVRSLQIKTIISTRIEHPSVYYTLLALSESFGVKIHWLDLLPNGDICYASLEETLAKSDNTLVSLMHANNELGNLLNIERVGALCRKYGALFHTDSVQTIGKYRFDLRSMPIDFAVASAHKFHGPKGTGFIYIRSDNAIPPIILGGAQERNMRAGTENVCGVVGMSKALDIAMMNLAETSRHILALKHCMISRLEASEKIFYNGNSKDLENSLYTILNLGFKIEDEDNIFIYNLDSAGICASAGSACSSGSSRASRVIENISGKKNLSAVRLSFSIYNTMEEIEHAAGVILDLVS